MDALISLAGVVALVYYVRKKINSRPERRRRTTSYRAGTSVNPPRPVNPRNRATGTSRTTTSRPATTPVTPSPESSSAQSSDRYGQSTAVLEYFANNPCNMSDNWFSFEFIKVQNEWRAYIERMPDLNGRDTDGHITHRYTDRVNDRLYVCFDPMPETLADSQNIARSWADHLLEYIDTGKTF